MKRREYITHLGKRGGVADRGAGVGNDSRAGAGPPTARPKRQGVHHRNASLAF
jgi:hypothetical protein